MSVLLVVWVWVWVCWGGLSWEVRVLGIPLPLENELNRLLNPSLPLLLLPLLLESVLLLLLLLLDGNSEARALSPLELEVVPDPDPAASEEPEVEADPELRAESPDVKEDRSKARSWRVAVGAARAVPRRERVMKAFILGVFFLWSCL